MTLEEAMNTIIEATTYEVIIQTSPEIEEAGQEIWIKSKPSLKEAIERFDRMEDLCKDAQTADLIDQEFYTQMPEEYEDTNNLTDNILEEMTGIDAGDIVDQMQADPCYAGGTWYNTGKLSILVCPNREYWDAEGNQEAKANRKKMTEAWCLINGHEYKG